ncbi:unnamed protein product [Choristocarpus tenellus]
MNDWQFLAHWDDWHNFLNPMAKDLLDNPKSSLSPTLPLIYVYEPAAWVSKAVVVAGLRALGIDQESPEASLWFRRVGLCLHGSNCALLLMVTTKLLRRMKVGTTHELGIWGCSLLPVCAFAVHPVNVEVVCWPSCFPYSLCLFFCLTSLNAHLRAEACQVVGLGLSFVGVFTSPALYAAAVLSKSCALLWPTAMVLVDMMPLPVLSNSSGQDRKTLFRWLLFVLQRLLYIGVAIMLGLATLMANRGGGEPDTDVISLDWQERIIKGAVTLWFYMGKLAWPSGLRPHYAFKLASTTVVPNSSCKLSASSVCVIYSFFFSSGKPCGEGLNWVLLAWLHYVVVFIPMSGVLQHGMVQKGGDR